MSDINRRNAETVRLSLDDMNKKVCEQQIQIEGLRSAIGTLNNKMEEVLRSLNMMRARQSGNGPTAQG